MSNRTTAPTRVLVVDDEASARNALTELLREESYDVRAAADGYKALGRADGWEPQVLITDVKMPGMDGIELMAKLREQVPGLPVIVMTAFGSVESAVAAIHQGADDYLTKPLHLGQLLLVLRRVLEHRELQVEAARLREELSRRSPEPDDAGLIGRSKAFRDLIELVRQVADSDASVLVTGESGTGKELIARAVHGWSNRRDKPFVALNCAALADGVLESELFGHAKGAVSGAATSRVGRLQQANGGTLFLDEIGELPPSIQVKLLRFLQEQSFEPVGSNESVRVDVRIVVATNRELHADVAAGRFREDLFYRLNVINLRVPTLRERREDIPLLAMHFLQKYCRKNHKTILGFHDRALGVLLGFDWPGNVRQLESCIERAVVLCRGQELEPRDLPRELMQSMRGANEIPRVPGASLREIERWAILKTLEYAGGSTSTAARVLGISPRKIQYRLNEYKERGAPSPASESSTTHH